MKKRNKLIGFILLFTVLFSAVLFVPAGKANKTAAATSDGKFIGVDVSSHNGTIDWSVAKANGVDFAIIRIGYGSDYSSQDDSTAKYNMAQCEKYKIPYGVYIYSYALTYADVDSEVNHTLRMISGYTPTLGIWFDMEDADNYKANHSLNPYSNGSTLTAFCTRYMQGIKNAGYSLVGVYANTDYFTNVLNYNTIKSNGLVWLAHWRIASPPSQFPCAMWQYTEQGRITGLSGNFDMNMIFEGSVLYDIIAGTNAPKIETFYRPSNAALMYGDVNGDNLVTYADLALMKKHITGQLILKGDAFLLADINQDGKISLADLKIVKQAILGIVDIESTDSTEAESTGTSALPEEPDTEALEEDLNTEIPEESPDTAVFEEPESISETEETGQEP